MHVPIERHRRIVGTLGGTLLVLFVLLIMAALNVGLFKEKKQSSELADLARYLKEEEVFIVAPKNETEEAEVLIIQKVLFEYVAVIDGCGPQFVGECLNARSGPGEEYSVVRQLRNGVVLKVGGKVERNGRTWYKIIFDETIRYPQPLNRT